MAERLIVHECDGTVAEALGRLEDALTDARIRLFAVVDHAAAARGAGLDLRDEIVAIFGNPAAGTALMQRRAEAGLDLPLRMLIWDAGTTTKLAYRAPTSLEASFDLADARGALEKLTSTISQLAARRSRSRRVVARTAAQGQDSDRHRSAAASVR